MEKCLKYQHNVVIPACFKRESMKFMDTPRLNRGLRTSGMTKKVLVT